MRCICTTHPWSGHRGGQRLRHGVAHERGHEPDAREDEELGVLRREPDRVVANVQVHCEATQDNRHMHERAHLRKKVPRREEKREGERNGSGAQYVVSLCMFDPQVSFWNKKSQQHARKHLPRLRRAVTSPKKRLLVLNS